MPFVPLTGKTKLVAQVVMSLLVVPLLNIFSFSGTSGTTSAKYSYIALVVPLVLLTGKTALVAQVVDS